MISANVSAHLRAWQQYAHGLRECLRHSSRQLSQAREAKALLKAQLDSTRLLLQECERQRDEALAVVDELNAEIQTRHGQNAGGACAGSARR